MPRAGAGRAAGDDRAPAPRPSTCRPASTGSSAARATGRGAERSSLPEALVAVSARAGLPLWIPPDVAGHCCATPVDLEGLSRTAPAGWPTTRSTRSGAGATGGELPIVCDASSCTLGLAEEAVGAAQRGERGAPREARAARLDRLGARAAAAAPRGASASSARSRSTRPARAATSSSTPSSRRSPPSSPTRSSSRSPRPAAASPATAACSTPSCRARRPPTRRPSSASRSFDAHLCSNRTCEIGLQQGTGRPYESFVFALEELAEAAG